MFFFLAIVNCPFCEKITRVVIHVLHLFVEISIGQ